jgi:integrase
MARSRSDTGRTKGNIEERGDSLRVRLYAGIDPVTGRQSYLRETIPGTDDAAWRKADDKLTEFRAQVLKQRNVASSVPFGKAVDEWMQNSEVVDSTRDGYVNYIERYIRPILGKQPVRKIDARVLEGFYAELRRCRTRCDKKPFVEHRVEGDHDCEKAECVEHKCKPLAKSTVRQIHSIISGTMAAAERWGGSTRIQRASLAVQAPNRRSQSRQRQQRRPSSLRKRSGWTTTGERSFGS